MSLSVKNSDYIYRIQRGRCIVYVSIQHPDILPLTDRTHRTRILTRLRDLPAWNGQRRTLTVTKTDRGIFCQADIFQPHALSKCLLRPSHYYNFLELPRTRRISDRISFVHLQKDICVLKIARFTHELPAFHTEIKVFSVLETQV